MIFRQLFDQVSSTYSYLLADERTREAVLVDPVFEQHARDAALIRELGLTPRYGAAVATGRTTSNPGIPSKSATLKV